MHYETDALPTALTRHIPYSGIYICVYNFTSSRITENLLKWSKTKVKWRFDDNHCKRGFFFFFSFLNSILYCDLLILFRNSPSGSINCSSISLNNYSMLLRRNTKAVKCKQPACCDTLSVNLRSGLNKLQWDLRDFYWL